MKISVVKETASDERRVILLPGEVAKLSKAGHTVSVEKYAGKGIHIYDRAYQEAGARVSSNRVQLFRDADLLVKLKAPTKEEFGLLNGGTLFSMLHHEQNPHFVYHLGSKDVKAVEIESIFNDAGERIIDATDITGEVGVLYAVQHLSKMPQDAKALILGYGRVGSGAISMCNKLGITTKILRKEEYPYIPHFMRDKDLLINAIAWPVEEREGGRYLVTSDMLRNLNPDAVILDLAVDFPNPIETCRPTSLSNPFYIEQGKIHVGIYGYPGLVPVSCSKRYSQQALPLVKTIADNGGLEGLVNKGDIGRFISSAIVDPDKLDWKTKKPSIGEIVSYTE